MSSTQKLTGILTLGTVHHEKAAEVFLFMRVGDTYLKKVKVIGRLATLLRDGKECTLWVATIRTPTPFFFKTDIHMVYAVGTDDGVVHQAIEEVRQEWAASKTLTFFQLVGVGIPTIFLFGLGLLFWINAARLPFAQLPLAEMRCDNYP